MLNTEKYLKECGLPHSLIGLIKIRASQINKCGYCLDMHHKDAIRTGETFQRLYLLPAWEESPCFTEEEKAVLNLTDILTEISKQTAHGIEEVYERVSQYYSKTQIANIVLAITQVNAWNRIAITFGNIPGSYMVD
jgi:AhpD family alkylhydroperoxidase